jgi:uncharacterized protein involved in response to NO
MMASSRTSAPGTYLLARGFRPFFLLAGLFAVIAMILWGYALAGKGTVFGPLWHGHEMLFGYAGAVIAGFVLTAASNWTGRPTLTGPALAALVLVWVADRIVVPMSGVPDGIKAALCAGFFVFLALGVGRPILATRGRRNYGIILVLLVFAALELFYWFMPVIRSRVLVATLLFTMVMVAIIGGRVIPAFTRNATPGLSVRPGGQWRDWLAMSSLVAFGVFVLCPATPRGLLAAFAALGAVTHALRMQGWGGCKTLGRPILWILQLAYLCLPAGLALYAARYLGAPVPFWVPLHVLAVGALGLMTLGMMTRVSLGHTGRVIVAGKLTTLSYVLLVAALLARSLGSLFGGGGWRSAMLLAAGLWSLAFLLFLVTYAKVLLGPRVDGKPG